MWTDSQSTSRPFRLSVRQHVVSPPGAILCLSETVDALLHSASANRLRNGFFAPNSPPMVLITRAFGKSKINIFVSSITYCNWTGLILSTSAIDPISSSRLRICFSFCNYFLLVLINETVFKATWHKDNSFGRMTSWNTDCSDCRPDNFRWQVSKVIWQGSHRHPPLLPHPSLFLSGLIQDESTRLQYTSCVQRSTAQSTTVHDALLHPHLRHCSSPASAVRRLPSAVRTATPAFHVRSSGLFCSRPGGLQLVTRLPARSVTFRWQISPRPEYFAFLVWREYTAH